VERETSGVSGRGTSARRKKQGRSAAGENGRTDGTRGGRPGLEVKRAGGDLMRERGLGANSDEPTTHGTKVPEVGKSQQHITRYEVGE
jgi:hypothetical protein